MSIILSRIVNSAPDKYKHPINYYVVPNWQIYGDFFRSVEATYYSREELTDEYIEYIHPNYLLSVIWFEQKKYLIGYTRSSVTMKLIDC